MEEREFCLGYFGGSTKMRVPAPDFFEKTRRIPESKQEAVGNQMQKIVGLRCWIDE
jgi:hypothetical protein